jgi:hypothetical protein
VFPTWNRILLFETELPFVVLYNSPHSGKELTFWQVVKAIRTVYNLGLPVALLLTIGGFALCGHRMRTRLDLHELAKHNKIEHNGSLAHDDVPDGEKCAPWSHDPDLLDAFLRQGEDRTLHEDGNDKAVVTNGNGNANGNDTGSTNASTQATDLPKCPMTLEDILASRLRRLSQIPLQTSRTPPLSKFHRTIMNGESALILLTFGDKEGKISREQLRIWFEEERLPDGWKEDVSGVKVGFGRMNSIAGRLNKMELAMGE